MKHNMEEKNNIQNEQYNQMSVIDRFEGTMAVLKFDDGQELLWPIKRLPEDCKEGAVVRVVISTAKTEEEEREKLAKTLINELLKNDS